MGLWFSFAEVAFSSAADIVSAGVSADRVDAARDVKRAFFLGGILWMIGPGFGKIRCNANQLCNV